MKQLLFAIVLKLTLLGSDEPTLLRSVHPESIRDSSLEQLLQELVGGPDVPIDRYCYNRVDLNNDRTPEVIAVAVGQSICGSAGCRTYVLRKNSSGYKIVTDLELSKTPILVSTHRTKGWNDLILYSRGYGGDSGNYAVLEFNGTTYAGRPDAHSPAKTKAVAYLADIRTGCVQLRPPAG